MRAPLEELERMQRRTSVSQGEVVSQERTQLVINTLTLFFSNKNTVNFISRLNKVYCWTFDNPKNYNLSVNIPVSGILTSAEVPIRSTEKTTTFHLL